MARDDQAANSTTLAFLVRFEESGLSLRELTTEVDYLRQDIQALKGMGNLRFQYLEQRRGDIKVRNGLKFEVPADRIRVVLRRLSDRLDDHPIETLILIQWRQVKLQIQTHRAEDLATIVLAAESLLPPDSVYLAKVEGYVRTQGELSPAEIANLNWLQQQLDLPDDSATWLQAKALGPYKTLEEKQQHFETVLLDEISRECPLSPDTWAVLEELAENLRLPTSNATVIYREHLQQVQAKAEVERQQAEAKSTVDQQQTGDQQQLEAEQQQMIQYQQRRDHYRDIFRRAISTTLFPLAFDQGKLEQARLDWELSADEAQHIEAEVRNELYGNIASGMGVDYSRLRQLLWGQDFLEADKETEHVILSAISQDMQPSQRDDIMRLPCLDLLTIDQLWSRYSNGKFGFQAQFDIYQQVERRPLDFLETVEWRRSRMGINQGFLSYQDLQFNLAAPLGHLPSWRWCCTSLDSRYDVEEAMVGALFVHLEKCLPTTMSPLLANDPPPSIPG
jgi:hypothetical protein